MEKTVTVIENSKEGIKVGCDASACSGCKSEMFCRNKDTVFTVENPSSLPLNRGDKVTIDIPEGRATLSVILSLALPLLLFLPGYFVGKAFFKSEISMALMGFCFMAVGFGISAIIFKVKKRYFSPIVLGKEEE
ncbi:MAG: SoxR reducing system RseC family protein [Candidatus Ornithospirochaeta sp.]